MVVIKYALVGCLLALGIFAYSKRDDVIDAYHWNPTIEKPRIPTFDPKAVAEAHQLPVPESDIRVAVAPDTRNAGLPVVANATTTTGLPMQGGRASVDGVVVGPGNVPVPAATVRIERFVGQQVVTVDVSTNSSGNFAVNQLLGGRYRVRAWRAPSMAQLGSEVAFINDGDHKSLRLALDAPNDLDISASAAARTVILGQSTTVSMRVLTPVVNGNGQVAKGGRANDLVVATGAGVFAGQGGQSTTDANGIATFPAQCTQVGSGSFTLQTPYYRESVDVACIPVPTTTTTTTTTTTVAAAPTPTTAKAG